MSAFKNCIRHFLTLIVVSVMLSACGGGGGSSTVVVTASAGNDQTVSASATVTLSAAASTVTGSTILSYNWQQVSGTLVTITNATSASASFTSPLSTQSSILRFRVTVTAVSGDTGTDEIDITVQRGFVVSGTITPTSGTQIDSDVNDPSYSFTANNSITNAQNLPNPVTLGGFVNATPTNISGDRFASVTDSSDFFKVQLAPGQIVGLTVARSTADLDLYLRDNNGVVVNASVGGVGVNESLTVPTTVTTVQDYYIEVRAASGISSYVLKVGLTGLSVQDNGYQLTSKFVPGELITRFYDDQIPPGASSDSLSVRANSVGMQALSGAPGRSMLMRVGVQAQFDRTRKKLQMSQASQAATPVLQQKLNTLLALKAMRTRGDIRDCRLNYIYQSLATPNDTNYTAQWHYPLINLPQAWDVTQGSANVIVAVIDTGVLLNHPDMQGKLVSGYDFIRDPAVAADGGGIDANPDDPGDKGYGFSSTFHGTHVAGTIGAATNNGIGVAGVGWNVKVMPLRALGVGGGNSYDIEQAVRYAAGLPNDSGTVPAKKADVINLSLGGPGGTSTQVPQAYSLARSAGVIIVAAAGNDATSTPLYPASYNGIVSVSAVDLNKSLAPYSSFGAYVDVAAPGGDASRNLNGDQYPDAVMSTQGSDASGSISFTYGLKQGTSMATPHIAGVVALMKSVHSGLTPQQFDDALASGAITEDLGTAGRDNSFGHGLIDALAAVLHAQVLAGGGVAPANPFLAVTPGSLNFSTSGVNANLDVRNAGTGTLTVTSVTEDSGGWLTITAGSVDASGLGRYILTVDRTGLSDNIYTATITITSAVNTVTIPVIMQKQSLSSYDDAGLQYVLVFDTTTSRVVNQVAVTAVNGSYTFTFQAVAPGTYQIFAGTDIDNDGYICGTGESCGVYPDNSPNQLSFTLSADLLNANLITGFSNIAASSTLTLLTQNQSQGILSLKSLSIPE